MKPDDANATPRETPTSDRSGTHAKPAARTGPENTKDSLDRQLDEGIEETFPASDPVAVKITK